MGKLVKVAKKAGKALTRAAKAAERSAALKTELRRKMEKAKADFRTKTTQLKSKAKKALKKMR